MLKWENKIASWIKGNIGLSVQNKLGDRQIELYWEIYQKYQKRNADE